MFQTNVVEKIKTHILCPIKFSVISVFNAVMWKNIVEPSRPQMLIWHMHSTCWIPKSTNTHSEYEIWQ